MSSFEAFDKLLTSKPVPEARPELAERLGDPKILTLDIETKPAEVYTYGLFNQNISITQIKDPGQTMSFAAKWYGKPKVEFWSDFHNGHEGMVQRAWELLDEAEVLVTYNGDKFDLSHLNREFLLWHLGPPSPYRTVDLLKVMRKHFKWLSNKLDFVSQQLGIGAKVQHEGFPLWVACMEGDPKAWSRMKKYNIGDVRLTEDLLVAVRPWIKNHPHLGRLEDTEPTCNKCGSTDLERHGDHPVGVLVYERFRCNNCGGWVRGNVRIGRVGVTYGI